FRFGKLGFDLVRRLGAQAFEPVCDFAFAVFASPWRRPIEDSIECLRATLTTSLESGDVAHAGYAAVFLAGYRHFHGAPLRELIEETRRNRKLCARLGLIE